MDRTRELRARRVVILGLSALMTVVAAPAQAATISSYLKNRPEPPRISSGEVEKIQAFLKGGPALWATAQPPKFPAGLVIADARGNLLNKPVVNYLIWRRATNPSFFDARHPRVAPLFQQYDNQRQQILAQIYAQYQPKAMAKTSTASLAPRSARLQVLTPPTNPATTPSLAAQTVQPVPEPASVASTLVLFAACGFWWRGRGRSAG